MDASSKDALLLAYAAALEQRDAALAKLGEYESAYAELHDALAEMYFGVVEFDDDRLRIVGSYKSPSIVTSNTITFRFFRAESMNFEFSIGRQGSSTQYVVIDPSAPDLNVLTIQCNIDQKLLTLSFGNGCNREQERYISPTARICVDWDRTICAAFSKFCGET